MRRAPGEDLAIEAKVAVEIDVPFIAAPDVGEAKRVDRVNEDEANSRGCGVRQSLELNCGTEETLDTVKATGDENDRFWPRRFRKSDIDGENFATGSTGFDGVRLAMPARTVRGVAEPLAGLEVIARKRAQIGNGLLPEPGELNIVIDFRLGLDFLGRFLGLGFHGFFFLPVILGLLCSLPAKHEEEYESTHAQTNKENRTAPEAPDE